MEETDAQRARRQQEEAVRYAHTAIELVSALAADLLEKGRLKPVTKTRIGDAVREYERGGLPSTHSIERLKRALKGEAPLEREEKRLRPD